MTIDESIAKAREKAKEQRYYANFEKNYLMRQSCLKCAEEYEQLAEWLEELKQLREERKNKCKDCAGCTQWKCDCSNIRDEAIDDFASRIVSCANKFNIDTEDFEEFNDNFEKTVYKLAEQLKAGVTDAGN